MKNIRNIICCLLALILTTQFVFAADDEFLDEQAKDNLQMSLLEFKAKNDNFNVEEEEINVCRIAENKTLRMSITFFMMSMYGIVVSGDNNIEELKIEILDDSDRVLMSKKMSNRNREAIILSAEYTGEYQVNITPTRINGSTNDFKTGWISWAVLYEE